MVEDLKKKTILFLLNDYDLVLLKVIKNKFKKDAGWESIITTSFHDAMSEFKRNNPDVVVTEIILKDTENYTGFDLITAIKKEEKKTKIIVFTDLSQSEDEKKAKKLGAHYYFVKSQLAVNDLIRNIQEIL